MFVCLGLLALNHPAAAIQNGQGAAYTAPDSAEAARSLLRDGFSKYQNNDFAGALDGFRALIGSRGFALLSDREKHAVYFLLGASELHSGDPNAALKMLRISTQSSEAIGIEWHLRLIAAYKVQDYDDCVTSLTTIAQQWPNSLSQLNDQAMFLIARQASEKSDAVAINLLEPLHQLHWTPKDRFEMPDRLWLELAQAYADTHDQVHEIAALDDVHDPGLLIYVRSDKRFDSAVNANPAHYDFQSALEADLAAARRLAHENPDRLEGVNTLADVLIKIGRSAEALTISDDALAREKSVPQAFSDSDDYLNWTYDNRARALSALGRHQEVLELRVEAARMPEHGAANVSQVINLADAYNSNGQPEDALKALSGLERAKPTPYGLMALEHARGCAFAQLHDQANLQKSLGYLKAHAADGRGPLLETLICANDRDGAAKQIISELEDASSRGGALYLLQDYLDDPGATAIDKQDRADLVAIRGRPDVARAISAVGRTDSYPILSPGL